MTTISYKPAKRLAALTATVCLVALVAAGCSGSLGDGEEDELMGKVPVSFAGAVNDTSGDASASTIGGNTRAGDVANLYTMGVFACYTGTADWTGNQQTDAFNFMYNQIMTRSGDQWTYSPLKYWPNTAGEKVSFFAYAPHVSLFPPNALKVPEITDMGDLWFYYVTPLAADEQKDLLMADPVLNRTKNAGTVAFSFKHLTAKIVFKVKSSDAIRVKLITINKATTGSYFYIDTDGIYPDGLEIEEDRPTFTATVNKDIAADTLTEVATFFMLPTTVKADDPVYGCDTTVGMTYIQNGNTETLTAALPNGWKAGEVMIFNLALDKTKLDVIVDNNGGNMTWGGSGTGENIHDDTTL